MKLLSWLPTIGLITLLTLMVYYGNGNDQESMPLHAKLAHKQELFALHRDKVELLDAVASLREQIKVLEANVARLDREQRRARQAAPTLAAVQQEMQQALSKPRGFEHEIQRVLGDVLDVRTIRVHKQ